MTEKPKRVRPRKTAVPPPKEIELHVTVANLLRDRCLPDWRWTHIPSGERRGIVAAAKLKRMGTQRGWPDFILLGPGRILDVSDVQRSLPPTTYFLELKRVGASLNEEQKWFMQFCRVNGYPHRVAHTVEEVLKIFSSWKCLNVVPRNASWS